MKCKLGLNGLKEIIFMDNSTIHVMDCKNIIQFYVILIYSDPYECLRKARPTKVTGRGHCNLIKQV